MCVSMPSAVQSMSMRNAAGRWQRAGTAQLGEGGLGARPLRIVASDNQKFRRDAHANAEGNAQRGRRVRRECIRGDSVYRDLLMQHDAASSECA